MKPKLAVLIASLGACQPATDPVPQPGGSANYSSALGTEPDFNAAHSRVLVVTWLEYSDTSLSGYFADGPPLVFQTESQRSGNCRLLSYTPSNCAPACTGGDVCIEGQCAEHPGRTTVGPMTWTWPDGSQEILPDDIGGYYGNGTATQAGEVAIAYGEITLKAPTIAPPDPKGDWHDAIAKRAGGDAILEWSNPVAKARVRLHMTDCAGSHGGIGVHELECEGPDSGRLTIAAAFLDAMEDGDWSHGECGSHRFERYHAAAPVDDDTTRLETIGKGDFFYRPDF